MKLTVNNKTEYLNEYFFQTLLLLYFQGEKFPKDNILEDKSATFELEERNGGVWCCLTIETATKKEKAEAFVTPSMLLGADNDMSGAASVAAGRAFLECGRRLFGFELPWGQLTGIRPAKRALGFLEKGKTEEEVRQIFKNDYSASEEKIRMCLDIASRQREILRDITENDCSLYVAIPFCPTRCDYCSFVSYSGPKLFSLIPAYMDMLVEDIKLTADLVKKSGMRLSSIYIGGGTPTTLEPNDIDRLLTTINENFDMTNVREYTLESGRPDTITEDKFVAAKRCGITRVSINPQTLNEKVLQNIGRHHTVKQFFEAYDVAKKFDFEINTDLIAGLPEDTFDSFENTLDDIIKLDPDNITVHTMSIKNAAALRSENLYDPKGEMAKKCVSFAYNELAKNGYAPYYLYRQKNTVGNAENCGYSKKGKECLYNIMTMEDRNTVFACGASALTKIVTGGRIERFAFPKYPFEYLQRGHNIYEKEILEIINQKGS